MSRKLKVFRTSAGFDDAYVAAPSRKAALAAWGADADLFARGVAEEVTDPALMEGPLARPGEVIRLSRGDLGDHLKALPPRRKKPAAKKAEAPTKTAKPRKATRPPARDKVAAAEAALAEAREKHAAEASELEAARDAIERQLTALRAKQDKEFGKLQRTLDAERETYRAALERWSG